VSGVQGMTKEEVLQTLNSISDKMSKEEYYAVLSFLYPEDFPPNDSTNKVIESLKEKAKKHFKAERKGNEVVIEILD